MMIIYLKEFERKWTRTSILKDDSILFVSDSTPQGFQWICEYIDDPANHAKLNNKTWYRVVVPFSTSYSTPAQYRIDKSNEPILASFDASDLFSTLQVEEIKQTNERMTREQVEKMDWPFPHQGTIKDLYGNAYCSQRHLLYPDLFIGCTEIQQFYLLPENHHRIQRELALLASSRFRIELKTCLAQLKQVSIRPELIYHPFIAKAHLKGPIPGFLGLDEQTLVNYFMAKIKHKDNGYFPFDSSTTNSPGARVYFCNQNLITFPTLKELLDTWYERKLDQIILDEKTRLVAKETETDRARKEKEFIQQLLINHFAKQDRASKDKLLTFFDLSKKGKRRRLLEWFGYEDLSFIDHCMQLPVSNIGRDAFDSLTFGDGDGTIQLKKPRFTTAREMLEKELCFYQKHKRSRTSDDEEDDVH